ncbi:MAG: hypothetical protein ACYC5J_06765 [Chloroflexota bacterium]
MACSEVAKGKIIHAVTDFNEKMKYPQNVGQIFQVIDIAVPV